MNQILRTARRPVAGRSNTDIGFARCATPRRALVSLPADVRQVEETCPTVRPGNFSLRISKSGRLQVLCFEAPRSGRA
jgi:hypothetical protein